MMKLKVIAPNQTEVSLDLKTLFFSYDTLVLVRDFAARKCYVTEDKFSKTTSKHINQYIKGEGISPDRIEYVSQASLEQFGNYR